MGQGQGSEAPADILDLSRARGHALKPNISQEAIRVLHINVKHTHTHTHTLRTYTPIGRGLILGVFNIRALGLFNIGVECLL